MHLRQRYVHVAHAGDASFFGIATYRKASSTGLHLWALFSATTGQGTWATGYQPGCDDEWAKNPLNSSSLH